MLRNLNIRQRLLAVYVVFAVLIMALGGFGLYAARANNESIQLYTFPAEIELEYKIPEGSDAIAEVKKCVQYCKEALA